MFDVGHHTYGAAIGYTTAGPSGLNCRYREVPQIKRKKLLILENFFSLYYSTKIIKIFTSSNGNIIFFLIYRTIFIKIMMSLDSQILGAF